ncbi:DUF1934 domain-containing protein [Serpentinicella sp. ANB-PHB4]|uniref:DUF1934 domain-containing protein n=1 Tax=Serpentinicella sp. ANB-PHB4 TaxID=3074076 RepID=UPI00285D3B55|nr:DUF1934 domain-containing protein [Serpentinicella sp. ANB-PHB4]MDR5659128.1 DUF1934 domain-containing protein [Serpentinicella sp. ANB-PHB4]
MEQTKNSKVIRVTGVQKIMDDENKIELTTEAALYKKNNHLYIVYEESEISGMKGTTTTLKVMENNKVSLNRFGANRSQFLFAEGETCKTQYDTIYGNLQMEVYTNFLEVDIDFESYTGKIEIRYDLNISESKEQLKNSLKVELL